MVGDFWSDLRDEAIDSVEDSAQSTVQKEFDAMYDKVADEVADGVKGEWYSRLAKLVGDEQATKIYGQIHSQIFGVAAPLAIGASTILIVVGTLAFFLGRRK